MPNRVMHFEIHAADPQRARKFYGAVFGWTFEQWMEEPPYWGVSTAEKDSTDPGIDGGLMKRMGDDPVDGQGVNAYTCTVQVEDYDATHDRIMQSGGTVALPKQAIPGVAWMGYYKDTEGNIFGINQPDERAG